MRQSLNIDIVIERLILPLLKYPLLLVFPYYRSETYNISKNVYLGLFFYSILLRLILLGNQWLKCNYASEGWVPLNKIADLKVLVTGGSQGLGRSIITRLLIENPHINIVNIDIVDYPERNERIKTYICDLTNPEKLNDTISIIYADELFQGKKQFHLIVNNAGMRSKFKKFEDIEEVEMLKLLQVNSIAPVRIIQELSPMKNHNSIETRKQQCYIVNIASSLGILSPSKVSIYSASKASLIAFHNSLKYELLTSWSKKERYNIKTLLVIAGQLNTRMFAGFTPPRQFFAPIIDTDKLSAKIISKCNEGEFGQLNEPFYSNFNYILMSLPLMVQLIIRKISGMDDCLPNE